MAEPGDCVIVQIAVGHQQVGWQAFIADREAVILRGDFDLVGFQIQDGLVGAAVTELELERLRSAGETKQLMPEANPKNGEFTQQLADGRDGVRKRFRVARSIGQKDPVRIECEDVIRG